MKRLRIVGWGGLAVLVGLAAFVLVSDRRTERDIAAFQDRVAAIAVATPAPAVDRARWAALPAPVRRYFAFVFADAVPRHTVVRLSAEGAFRRPLTDTFAPTRAAQVIAIGTPALMFSATTPIVPGVWARAYDFFADGEMEMKAKLLSTVTVLDQPATPMLNRISLRRWLLESALFPQALLPGGPVTWQPIDDTRARAVVEAGGLRAAMTAHFDDDGRMVAMTADGEGDLTTPYHGSGEHVARSDYTSVGGQMIPMRFTVSRVAGGALYPFWDGRITAMAFE